MFNQYAPTSCFGRWAVALALLTAPTAFAAPLETALRSGTATAATPAVSAISPVAAATGATVTITGLNFTGATAVAFNGVAATGFTVVSNSSITAVVPANATTGKISVITPGGTGLSAAVFKVLPTISGFSPAKGVPGDTVTITGTGFTGATSVKFYTAATTVFRVIGSNTIKVVVPATAIAGKLYVLTPGGTAASAASFTAGPIISSFTPAQGAPGSVVLVNGLNLVSGTTVKINGGLATTTYNSSAQLTAVVPAAATTGRVSVTNTNGTTTGGTFTVVSGAVPTVTSFTPTSGIVGTMVTINGTNLTGATQVRFGSGVTSAVTVVSSTQVRAAVPAGAATGRIYVTTPKGMGQSTANFTVIGPPSISAIAPASGSPGSVVWITGLNFTGLTQVAFNGVPATSYTTTNWMNLYVVVPNGATTGPITITNAAGSVQSTTPFVVTTAPAPTITGFSPGSGPVGATVTINGTNFTGVTQVKFNNTVASGITVNSATRLTVTVPAGASTGKVFVLAAGGMAQSANNFSILLPPTVTGFSPAGGPVGTVVTINGSNLAGVTAVSFGGVAATTITPVSSIQVKATVPAGAVSGAIRVTTAAGTATSAGSFTVTPARPVVSTSSNEPLTLTVYPNPAHGQLWVQISGLSTYQPIPAVEIFDALHRRVRVVTLADAAGTISLQGIPAGLYTIRAGMAAERLLVE